MFELESQYNEIYFSSIPFVSSVGTRDFVDDESLKTSEMIDKMETSEELSHTSCPSPGAWYQEFEKPGYTIAVTISSKLSGSYNSANTAKNMILEASPDKKIALVDSRSTGPEIVMIVHKICECIKMGAAFDTVVKEANECARHTHIVFALSSFNNLIKNGRMNKIVGFIAGKLNFWGIGIGSDKNGVWLPLRERQTRPGRSRGLLLFRGRNSKSRAKSPRPSALLCPVFPGGSESPARPIRPSRNPPPPSALPLPPAAGN